ncbi:MAG: NUDIX hydrolase [Phycisphaerales bacterium]
MTTREQRRTIQSGPKFDFDEVTLEGRNGDPIRQYMIRHPGAVVVVPVLEGGQAGDAGGRGARLVMIRNRRFTLGRELWEFPAGTLEPPEPTEVCAARELEEEAGYRAGRVERLGAFYTTPGMTDELMHAYLATDLTQVGQHLMEDERITVEIVEASAVLKMIDRGELVDAKSMLALFLAIRQGKLSTS